MAMVEKLDLPFPLLSDPRGDLIKTLDLWNEEENVSEPAIVVLDRSGTVRRLYSGGRDFSDRPTEEALFAVLDAVGQRASPKAANRASGSPPQRQPVRPCGLTSPPDARRPEALLPGHLLRDGRDAEEARR